MAYKRTNKRRFRKRSYRKGKAPLSKRQYNAVKTLAIKQINHGREKMRCYSNVNEWSVPLQTGTSFVNDINGNQALNLIPKGDGGGQRTGLSITALRYNFRGHIKINGGASQCDSRTAVVRVVFGFTKGPLAESDVHLMYKGGYPVSVPSNISSQYLNFNLAKFFPIFDKVYDLTPVTQYQTYSGGPVYQTQNGRDLRFINVNYNFGKKGYNMKYPDDSLCYANEKNITALVICRNANDDTTVSVLNAEISGISTFTYTDS